MKKDKSKELFLQQLQRTPIIQAACEKINIARWTVYRWKKEDADFAKAFDQAMNEGRDLVNDVAISQLLNAIKNGNLGAVKFWLQNYHLDFKTKIEIEGRINTIQEMTPKQKELVKKALVLANLTINKKGENTNE